MFNLQSCISWKPSIFRLPASQHFWNTSLAITLCKFHQNTKSYLFMRGPLPSISGVRFCLSKLLTMVWSDVRHRAGVRSQSRLRSRLTAWSEWWNAMYWLTRHEADNSAQPRILRTPSGPLYTKRASSLQCEITSTFRIPDHRGWRPLPTFIWTNDKHREYLILLYA